MDGDHFSEGLLVAARQVPCDGNATIVQGLEDAAITLGKFGRRQETAEGIVDVRIEYPEDFSAQMLEYADKYSLLPTWN